MNSVSWMIYFTNILPAFAEYLCTVLVVIGAASLVYNIVVHVLLISEENVAISFTKMILPAALFWIAASFTSLIPSKNVLYLIAASEVSEKVLKEKDFSHIKEILKIELKKYEPTN